MQKYELVVRTTTGKRYCVIAIKTGPWSLRIIAWSDFENRVSISSQEQNIAKTRGEVHIMPPIDGPIPEEQVLVGARVGFFLDLDTNTQIGTFEEVQEVHES